MTETDDKRRMSLVRRLSDRWAQASLPVRITFVAVAVSYLGVLLSGLTAREPMVADEVIHYYMLVTQAGKLPAPNVDVYVPMAGWTYHRSYPHVFLWHYIGALVWLACGKAFWAVQVYQSLYWLQLLVATWALAWSVAPKNPWVACCSVLGLASLPMGQLFSILLFQDVPAVAQVVTSFLFLRRRRMFVSLLFMGLALSVKVTVFVLLPMYFLCMVFFYWRTDSYFRLAARLIVALVAIAGMCLPMSILLRNMGAQYYPALAVEQYLVHYGLMRPPQRSRPKPPPPPPEAGVSNSPANVQAQPAAEEKPEISATPGDLRIAVNWFIYFGGVFWGLLLLGTLGAGMAVLGKGGAWESESWPLLVGGWGLAIISIHVKEAPDARFFLPAFPFIIIGLSSWAVRMPGRRFWLPLFLAAALGQSGVVLAKAVSLRHISPAMQEAIDFMQKENPTGRDNYFMYPEGHDRLIPGTSDWSMGRLLHEFWRADNDERIRMLTRRGMRHVIVKKYKIRPVGPDTIDMGVYPQAFVDDLARDPRFEKVLENKDVIIYRVPIPAPVSPPPPADPEKGGK